MTPVASSGTLVPNEPCHHAFYSAIFRMARTPHPERDATPPATALNDRRSNDRRCENARVLTVLPLSQADRLPPGPGLTKVHPDIALAEQMMAAAKAAGLAEPPAIVDFAIDELDCEALLDRVPRPMSRGELQLCAILITLSAPITSLAIVDPTAGLDRPRSRVVAGLLTDLAEDIDVTVASEDNAFASPG